MGCATQGEKAAIVKELREKGYKLKHLLRAMGTARSTCCCEISKEDAVSLRDKELSEEIKVIFEHHKRVQRLMHRMKLKGKGPKEKYHSYMGEVGKAADNLIDRDFSTAAPLKKWTTDASQFSFSWGKCCLSPILGMNTDEIISYDLSRSPDLKGLILHSDQGWQYQHTCFRNELKKHGITQSMPRKGNCYDNCIMETFFGRMKNEMFYGYEKNYGAFAEFQRAVKEYIDYYNNERIQAKTKWMPSVKYREASMCLRPGS